jgi:hypothetical protein
VVQSASVGPVVDRSLTKKYDPAVAEAEAAKAKQLAERDAEKRRLAKEEKAQHDAEKEEKEKSRSKKADKAKEKSKGGKRRGRRSVGEEAKDGGGDGEGGGERSKPKEKVATEVRCALQLWWCACVVLAVRRCCLLQLWDRH